MRAPFASAWWIPLSLLVAMVVLIDTIRARGALQVRVPEAVRVDPDAAFPLEIRPAGSAGSSSSERGAGEVITIARRPQRVVLGNATLVDLALELLPPERVLALPDQARTWSRLMVPEGRVPEGRVHEEFLAKATLRKLGAEQMLALAPDLVLCSSFNASLHGSWSREAGIPVVSVPHSRSVAELRDVVHLLGRVLDVRDRADAVVADIDRRVADLARTASHRRRLTALAYSNFGGGGWCSGTATLADEMIRMTGMSNVAAALGRSGSTKFTFEDLHAADPDVIVVSAQFGEQDGASLHVLTQSEPLRGLKAVRTGAIVQLPPRLFSTGSQEILTAAERLAAAVDRVSLEDERSLEDAEDGR